MSDLSREELNMAIVQSITTIHDKLPSQERNPFLERITRAIEETFSSNGEDIGRISQVLEDIKRRYPHLVTSDL
jgi:hypothetical protein